MKQAFHLNLCHCTCTTTVFANVTAIYRFYWIYIVLWTSIAISPMLLKMFAYPRPSTWPYDILARWWFMCCTFKLQLIPASSSQFDLRFFKTCSLWGITMWKHISSYPIHLKNYIISINIRMSKPVTTKAQWLRPRKQSSFSTNNGGPGI